MRIAFIIFAGILAAACGLHPLVGVIGALIGFGFEKLIGKG